MWPYKPISWDKYYYSSSGTHERHNSLTSGLAAGITIGVFFTVFLLTFGCRLYSRRMAIVAAGERQQRQQVDQLVSRLRRRLSLSDLFSCPPPSEPPPSYEIAIRMPRLSPKKLLGQPPAFSEIYNTVLITSPTIVTTSSTPPPASSTSSTSSVRSQNHCSTNIAPPSGGDRPPIYSATATSTIEILIHEEGMSPNPTNVNSAAQSQPTST